MTESAESILETVAVPGQPPGPPPVEPSPQVQTLPLRFTGSGGEYFRIWVVNLLLTIVSLGIYSAWAKVRKTRYFWSNTQLDGTAFQYHGNPGAILRGRILVGILFVAYSVLGRISITAGLVALIVLGLLAPWFFYKAMRFKLTNTTWRGVRFGFDSTVGEAYAALLPAVVAWLAFTGIAAAGQSDPKAFLAPLLIAELVFFALVPFFHARIKRYQHRATRCGSQSFDFEPSTGAFYGLYAKTFLVVVLPAIVAGFMVGMLAAVTARAKPATPAEMWPVLVGVFAVFVPVYMLSGGYFFARLQQVVWPRTHGSHIRFATDISATRLIGLLFGQGALTLLTLGVYWPFAAVKLVRYQLECLSLQTAVPLSTIAAGAQQVEPSAAGEGAVDFFGWDLGL